MVKNISEVENVVTSYVEFKDDGSSAGEIPKPKEIENKQ